MEARPSCEADEQSNKQLLSVSRAHRLHRGDEAVLWVYLLDFLTSSPLFRSNQLFLELLGG